MLIVAGSEDEQTKLAGELANFGKAGGVGADAALAAAAALPGVDVIIVARGVDDEQVARLIQGANSSPRLERAAKVILRNSPAGRWSKQAISDRSLKISTATDAAGLTRDIDVARSRGGAVAMDEARATEYATRSARLLERIALSPSNQVLDVASAQSTLLAGLSDAREPVAIGSARVLALLNLPQSQPSLMNVAAADKTPDPVKIAMYKALSENVRFFGNQLDTAAVDTLRTALAGTNTPEVRAAAAEAIGSLNLPTEQAKLQILQPKPADAGAPPAP